jgi:diadenosine tetraphosphate (Ap4A) HIT family hydrolase
MSIECFLCKPNPALVVESTPDAFTMVGLGPLTKTFCLVASREHDRSLADMAVREPETLKQMENLRAKMESAFGPLLFTEHGRVPICRDDGDDHEQHCFHAHGLVYRTSTSIEESASSYYGRKEVFSSLTEALSAASGYEQYALLSPEPSRAIILSEPHNVPRQLMRTLVAIAEGVPDLADWRLQPRHDAALAMALHLRGDLGV